MFTNESINTDEIRDKLNLLDKYCFEQSITDIRHRKLPAVT